MASVLFQGDDRGFFTFREIWIVNPVEKGISEQIDPIIRAHYHAPAFCIIKQFADGIPDGFVGDIP